MGFSPQFSHHHPVSQLQLPISSSYFSMVNVLIHTDTRYPVNRKAIRRAVVDTFKRYKIEEITAEVSIAVIGRRKMNDLTKTYRKDETEHEVLIFALEEVIQNQDGLPTGSQGFINVPDNVLRLGDVILCWPKVLEAAASDNIMVDEEIYRLTVHGVEHLLGEHHE